jgi:hypothetical protein
MEKVLDRLGANESTTKAGASIAGRSTSPTRSSMRSKSAAISTTIDAATALTSAMQSRRSSGIR